MKVSGQGHLELRGALSFQGTVPPRRETPQEPRSASWQLEQRLKWTKHISAEETLHLLITNRNAGGNCSALERAETADKKFQMPGSRLATTKHSPLAPELGFQGHRNVGCYDAATLLVGVWQELKSSTGAKGSFHK